MIFTDWIKKRWAKQLIKKHTYRRDGSVNVLQLGFDVMHQAGDKRYGTK